MQSTSARVVVPRDITPPTHLLRIIPTGATSSKHAASLVAIHSLTLACYTTAITLPAPVAPDVDESDNSMSLSIVDLPLPDASQWSALSTFMYQRDMTRLFSHLLPAVPPPQGSRSDSQYATELRKFAFSLASKHNGALLLVNIQCVTGMFKNCLALGVWDSDLEYALQLSYDVLRQALMAPWAVRYAAYVQELGRERVCHSIASPRSWVAEDLGL